GRRGGRPRASRRADRARMLGRLRPPRPRLPTPRGVDPRNPPRQPGLRRHRKRGRRHLRRGTLGGTHPMCGRYTLSAPSDDVAALFDLDGAPILPERYNIAPTQEAAVVRELEGE